MKITLTRGIESHELDAEYSASGIVIQCYETQSSVHVLTKELPRLSFLLDGIVHTARVVREGNRRWVHWNGQTIVLERGAPRAMRVTTHEREGAGSGMVTAPMPGQVRGVLAQMGDWVEAGQPLILLEAMKMEIRVTATRAGQIVQFDVREGQSVEREQVLARIADAAESNE